MKGVPCRAAACLNLVIVRAGDIVGGCSRSGVRLGILGDVAVMLGDWGSGRSDVVLVGAQGGAGYGAVTY